MVVVETIARIRREFFVKGKSIKEIVRDLKVSRNTVRKVRRERLTLVRVFEELQGLGYAVVTTRCADMRRRGSANGRRWLQQSMFR